MNLLPDGLVARRATSAALYSSAGLGTRQSPGTIGSRGWTTPDTSPK